MDEVPCMFFLNLINDIGSDPKSLKENAIRQSAPRSFPALKVLFISFVFQTKTVLVALIDKKHKVFILKFVMEIDSIPLEVQFKFKNMF